MSASKPEAVVAGHLCLDLFPRFVIPEVKAIGEVLRPGQLINMGAMAVGTGGPVSNTGFAMHIFGAAVRYVARVGDDEIGQVLARAVERYGSREGLRVAPGEPTSYSVVLALPGIDRIFLHCPGTNDTFQADDVDYGLLRQVRLFHFGYPALMRRMYADGGDELSAIFRRAKESGATTSLDTALPDPPSPAGRADWRRVYRLTLPHTDLFVPSIEEAFFALYPGEYLARKAARPGEDLLHSFTPADYERVSAEFLGLGCAMVGLKAGEYGWYFRTAPWERLREVGRLAPRVGREHAGRQVWAPSYRIDRIASSTGAGDVSIAGFLTGLLRGHDPFTSVRLGNSAARQNLTALDSLSGLKGWKETEEGLRTLEARDLPFLREAGWSWNAEWGCWVGA